MEWRNWSGLESARPEQMLTPRSAAEVQEAVRDARAAGRPVKMVGTGHSFPGIAVPEHTLLLPDGLRGDVSVAADGRTVTAGAGTPLHELNRELETRGLSLANMGDVAEQTLAGAVSTGTHGAGGRATGLASQLAALELVTGDGDLLRASPTENPEVFKHARVGLGALGVLTSLTFDVEPLFWLEARERSVGWDEGTATLLALSEQHDHLDAYWFPHTDRMSVKTNDRVHSPGRLDPLPRWREWWEDEFLNNRVFGLMCRLGGRVPQLVPPLNQVSARGVAQRSYCDVAHRVFTSPREVKFREMEYALPREAGVAALQEARRLIEASGWRIAFPVEIRVGPGDDVPLSPSYGRDTVYLSFHTWAGTDHRDYFGGVEQVMVAHEGRPHWGKLHTRTAAELAPAYPLFEDFRVLRGRLDPGRIFENAYLRRVLG